MAFMGIITLPFVEYIHACTLVSGAGSGRKEGKISEDYV